VRRFGGGRVALAQLGVSGLCCLLSPVMFFAPTPLFVAFLLLWGITVAGDSPQFSALTAGFAPRALVGSALTLANSIGFAITIVSLALLERLQFVLPPAWLLVPLAFGPLFGLLVGRPLLQSHG
jgi:MFS family permease